MKRTVLVLGAGFTKAFFPGAPLMLGDFGVQELEKRFAGFETASRVLRQERSQDAKGRINIERLMTRLDGGMPYDSARNAREELALLLGALKQNFLSYLLEQTTQLPQFPPGWIELARHCLMARVAFITFNYDDALDAGLARSSRIGEPPPGKHPRRWSPTSGYGFYCRPSWNLVSGTRDDMVEDNAPLLKLHGSVNWWPLRGATSPYAVNAIVHHESWSPEFDEPVAKEIIASHLEGEPFIVPPVLMKSAIVAEPILRTVWSRAFQILQLAERVIFVGYSLPLTDIAAKTLFSEALQRGRQPVQIEVVGLADDEEAKEQLCHSYRLVIPNLPDDHFRFDGAVAWASDFVREETTPSDDAVIFPALHASDVTP